MYSHRNYQYFGGDINNNSIVRDFPPLDVNMFNQSAIAFKNLLKDASTFLDHLADHKDFASTIMSAAQESDSKKVEKLIKSTGITSNVEPSFNPDGLTVLLIANVKGTDCCKLTMTFRWR